MQKKSDFYRLLYIYIYFVCNSKGIIKVKGSSKYKLMTGEWDSKGTPKIKKIKKLNNNNQSQSKGIYF